MEKIDENILQAEVELLKQKVIQLELEKGEILKRFAPKEIKITFQGYNDWYKDDSYLISCKESGLYINNNFASTGFRQSEKIYEVFGKDLMLFLAVFFSENYIEMRYVHKETGIEIENSEYKKAHKK